MKRWIAISMMGLSPWTYAELPKPQWARPGSQTLLRVMTYNIQGLPLPQINQGKYKPLGRTLYERRKARNAPHLVAIQEAFHSNAIRDLPRYSRYPYGATGLGARPLRISSGLLILSEFRLDQYDEMYYRDCSGTDCLASKAIQRARIKVPVNPLEYIEIDFFNTHMNADNDALSSNAESRRARMKQVRQYLGEFISRHRFGDLLAIFTGDFNFRVGEPDYEVFRDRYQSRSMSEFFSGQAHPRTLDHQFVMSTENGAGAGGTHRVRVEPIAYRRSFDGTSGSGAQYSDHVAVEVDYRLTVLQ